DASFNARTNLLGKRRPRHEAHPSGLPRKAAHRPRSRHQLDATVALHGKAGAKSFPQGGSALVGERHAVAGRRGLPTEKWHPVVVEIAEHRRDVDGPHCHIGEIGILEESSQWLRLADWEPATFVLFQGTGIERDGRIPEVAHHLHLASVVPDVSCHGPAGTRYPCHFGYGLGHVRDKVDDEAGNDDVVRPAFNRKLLRVADAKRRALVGDEPARVLDEAGRGIDAQHLDRCSTLQNCLRECAGTAANIEPTTASLLPEPFDEHTRHQAAPAPDIRLIGVAARPYILACTRHCFTRLCWLELYSAAGDWSRCGHAGASVHQSPGRKPKLLRLQRLCLVTESLTPCRAPPATYVLLTRP